MTVFDSATGERLTQDHKFTSLKILEGSGVTKPAQEPAVKVLLMKRLDDGTPRAPAVAPTGTETEQQRLSIAKNMAQAALTSASQGHTHLLDLDLSSGFTSWEYDAGSENGHSHPYVISAAGIPTIGEAEGHTHDLAVVARKDAGDGTNPDQSMTPEEQAVVDAQKAADATRIQNLETEVEAQKTMAGMSDAQRSHFDTLKDVDAAKAFMGMDSDARNVEVAKAAEADAVVYTAKNGDVFRKSDDIRMVNMAKERDESAVKLKKAEDALAVSTLKTRATTELAHVPGTVETRMALLKGVDAIEDEGERGLALEALKANDSGLGLAYQRNGTSTPAGNVGGDGTAATEIRAEAQKIADKDGISIEAATAKFVKTPKGVALRKQHTAAQPAGA